MNLRPRIMLIDANALGHVVKHATKELSFRGDRTGVLFGFIQKLFKIQSEVMAHHIVFCWDSFRDDLFRRDMYPPYKQIEEGSKSELDQDLDSIARPQFVKLRREVLPKMGFRNQILIKGLEADDTIAQLVIQFRSEYDMIIVSRDNDLHQLLKGEEVKMFDPVKMGYFSEAAFREKWGIGPENWEFVKAIAGCGGDGVPGIPGVGEKTAIKFLNGELKCGSKKHTDICDNEEQAQLNLRLVKLPWESTPNIILATDNLSVEGFIEVCKQYGFNSFLEGEKFIDFRDLFLEV